MPLLHENGLTPKWQYLVQEMSPRLKDYYSLGPEDGGVLLNYVIPNGGPYRFGLRANDILLEIDENRIDNYGEILFEPLGQRIHFGEILDRKRVGEQLTIKAIRAGKVMEIQGSVTPGLPRLVPKIFGNANYFICGGIAFLELNHDCIRDLAYSARDRLPLLMQYLKAFPERPFQRIVVVLEIFPEYGLVETEPYLARPVEKVDGKGILNIQDFFDRIQSLRRMGKKKVLLEISQNKKLALDLEKAEELDGKIMKKYGILHMVTPEGFS
jgi:hypothetical protein